MTSSSVASDATDTASKALGGTNVAGVEDGLGVGSGSSLRSDMMFIPPARRAGAGNAGRLCL